MTLLLLGLGGILLLIYGLRWLARRAEARRRRALVRARLAAIQRDPDLWRDSHEDDL